MCSRYTIKKDEAKIRRRELLEVFGFVPRDDIRPTRPASGENSRISAKKTMNGAKLKRTFMAFLLSPYDDFGWKAAGCASDE